MKMSPLQRRKARKRDYSLVDMNLVSLIDIFTLLIFFLLANSTEVETLTVTQAIKLPESTAEKAPKEAVVVLVSDKEILVQGHAVARVADFLDTEQDVIEPLRAELEAQAGKQIVRKENEPGKQAVTILGDKEIPYRLLRKVMVSCARANFTDISFAVNRKNGS